MGKRAYSIDGEQTVDSSIDTVLGLTSATTIRPAIYFAAFGLADGATPSDVALEWILQRYTAAGTSTSVTPLALSPVDAASAASAGEDHTVEPTYTAGAIVLRFGLHTRQSAFWQARDGCELQCPSTASNGIGTQPSHASFTGNVVTTQHFIEN